MAVSDVDIVLDPLDDGSRTRSLSVLRPGGLLLSILKPATFPLAEAAEAHARAETGRTTGKIVLVV